MMRAQASVKLGLSTKEFPDPPEFPDDLGKTRLAEYRKEHKAWWDKAKIKLREMDAAIEDLRQKMSNS